MIYYVKINFKIRFYGKKSLIKSGSLKFGLETTSKVINFFKNIYFKDSKDSVSKIGNYIFILN